MKLPIIGDCTGCGACCRQTPLPPFEPGEESVRDVPPELMDPIQKRIESQQQFELIPCVWFDQATELCLHYEYRPEACRRFEVNSFECHAAINAERYP